MSQGKHMLRAAVGRTTPGGSAEQGEPSSAQPRSAGRPDREKLLREATTSASGVMGAIESTANGYVRGWLHSPGPDAQPVLLVDGQPAELLRWPAPRRDVSEVVGTGEAKGFKFRLPGLSKGARLELHALVGQSLEIVATRETDQGLLALNPARQLERAAALARDPDSVAITCWDGGHNPVGRAKVLYDVVRESRPAVLFCYSFPEFGGRLWRPLLGADMDIVLIPWQDRDAYHEAMRALGLRFHTVWMCKPRLPTFQLAAQVAHPDARVVLDIDDNEEHFSLSVGSRRKVYGLPGLGQARTLTAAVGARTVASRSLQEDFGGRIVRHARPQAGGQIEGRRSSAERRAGDTKHVAFIGTVRPHKNLVAAATAIAALRSAGRDIRFHVMGDVSPDALKDELIATGATVGGLVPMNRLPQKLQAMDCIVTGFPSSDESDRAVTKYQISSKIGDALAAGRPVLVPEAESVADLETVPGVYLFDESSFAQRLCAALDSEEDIELPHDFSLAGAAESFERALDDATSATRAASALGTLVPRGPARASADRTLLLLWKQHDGSLYGRRVDQLARAYRRAHPGSRVVVLEMLQEGERRAYTQLAGDVTSDAAAILSLADAKTRGGLTDAEGVEYDMLEYKSADDLRPALERYLVSHVMLPSNTHIVLFPILRFFEKVAETLAPYRKTVDVVDNHLSWTNDPAKRREAMWQYNVMVQGADQVVFNSAANRDYFLEAGILPRRTNEAVVIPNWYLPPDAETSGTPPAAPSSRRTVVYSGNMNNRVDWDLLMRLVDESPELQLVLVGTAARAPEDFDRLLQRPNVVYLGVLSEADTLQVLQGAELALVPHVVDDVSTYMNPLKVLMYEALGLTTVAIDVPGLGEETAHLRKTSREDFVETVQKSLGAGDQRARPASPRVEGREGTPENAQQYVSLLSRTPCSEGRIT